MARSALVPFQSGGLLGGDPFILLHREVNRLFDDVLQGAPLARKRADGERATAIMPQMNVSETDSEVSITAELPGVSEDDIQVDLNDNMLSLRAEKKEENKREAENYHIIERSFGTFQRSLELPFSADPDKVQANFHNGVLTIKVPKSSQQERKRRIHIQHGESQTALQDSSDREASSKGAEQADPNPSGTGGENSGN